MKLVVIENCGHDFYAKTLDVILKETPFALINQAYNNTIAYFMFWDSAYVPDELKVYIKDIPQNPEKTQRINDKLKKLIKQFMS
ncbi:MAG: hypothetical protein ACTSPK_00200 [Candidatus Heimdallarchaeota archaeon]